MSRLEAAGGARRFVPWLLLAGIFGAAFALARGARLEPAQLVFNNGAEPTSLDPQVISGVPEGRIARSLFEGLCVLHPETLEPLPGMAERWELSEDGRTYTFHLRRGARWSNGEEFTAHDMVYSWKRALTPSTGSLYAYQLWYIVGAERYTTEVDEDGEPLHDFDTVGVRALDTHTLEVRLEEPTPFFLELTAFYALYPVNRTNIETAKELWPDTWNVQWMRPENIVTNGPYRIDQRRINDRIRLVRSETYWDVDNVAIESMDALAIEQVGTGLNVYLTGGHSWMDKVPTNLVADLMRREDFMPSPYFGSYFYRVNVQKPPFDDKRVRKALSLAIPRKAICEKVTKAGELPAYSLVPPTIRGYTPAECEREDLARAKALLVEAGYGPDGREFPTIEIHYNTLEMHRDIAEVIGNTWGRELGIPVKLNNQEWKVYLDTQNRIGYDVSRSAWIGDYLDPNTFIDMFVTDGENNRTGWSHDRYDELVAAAKQEPDTGRRYELFQEAEAILMEELPILPIYYYVTRNIVNPRLGGFHGNALDVHYPKFWYLRDDEELARLRAELPEGKVPVEAPGPNAGVYSAEQRRARGEAGR